MRTSKNNRWILTKSCDFQPDGSLRLGQILADPKDPTYILQPTGPLPLHGDLIIDTTSSEDINIAHGSDLSAHFDTWANFLTASNRLELSAKNSTNVSWHFDELASKTMAPSNRYVEEAMRHGDVPARLREWSFRKRVYMVTGVRVVMGATTSQRDESASKISASGQASLQHGVDPSVGAKGELSTRSNESTSVGAVSDIVFAYRLQEVKYRGKITHRPYKGGEVAQASDEPIRDVRSEVFIEDFEVVGVDDDAWKGDAKNFDKVVVDLLQGDLECYLAK